MKQSDNQRAKLRASRRTILKAALGTAFAGAAGLGATALWLRPAQEQQGQGLRGPHLQHGRRLEIVIHRHRW